MSDNLLQGPEALIVLLLISLLAHEPFRWLGFYLGRGIDAGSEVFIWVRAVSTALVAGLVSRLVIFPAGTLDDVAMTWRISAVAIGLGIYALTKHLGAGVFGAAAALLVLMAVPG